MQKQNTKDYLKQNLVLYLINILIRYKSVLLYNLFVRDYIKELICVYDFIVID